MAMNRDFLDWPFFEPQHRAFAADLDAWAATHVGHSHGSDRASVDAACHVTYVSGRLSTSRSSGNIGVRNVSVRRTPAPSKV